MRSTGQLMHLVMLNYSLRKFKERTTDHKMMVISTKRFLIKKNLPLTGAPSIISNLAIVSFSLYKLEPRASNRHKQLLRKSPTVHLIEWVKCSCKDFSHAQTSLFTCLVTIRCYVTFSTGSIKSCLQCQFKCQM